MSDSLANEIVTAVLKELGGRKGISHVLDEIRYDNPDVWNDDLLPALVEVVQSALEKPR